jgi:hypothetical protein
MAEIATAAVVGARVVLDGGREMADAAVLFDVHSGCIVDVVAPSTLLAPTGLPRPTIPIIITAAIITSIVAIVSIVTESSQHSLTESSLHGLTESSQHSLTESSLLSLTKSSYHAPNHRGNITALTHRIIVESSQHSLTDSSSNHHFTH